MGWADLPEEVEQVMESLPIPMLSGADSDIVGSGSGKQATWWMAMRQANDKDYILHQTIGDCVSQGAATAVDYIRAVQIANGHPEPHKTFLYTATEGIYGSSRIEVGGGRISGDGSTGAWGAKAVNTYGTLLRQTYGSFDLTTYSGNRARAWGKTGLPDPLEPTSRMHLVRTVSRIRTYQESIDALVNGYFITIASNQGFGPTSGNKRDSEGFLRPSGKWAHQMALIGFDDSYRRPGVLIMNSWGPNWVGGPKRLDQPSGSFWCDAEVLEKNILQRGEGWVFSQFDGYQKQPELIDFSALL
jgi:hypothetical protein